jgi:hypothetical protein
VRRFVAEIEGSNDKAAPAAAADAIVDAVVKWLTDAVDDGLSVTYQTGGNIYRSYALYPGEFIELYLSPDCDYFAIRYEKAAPWMHATKVATVVDGKAVLSESVAHLVANFLAQRKKNQSVVAPDAQEAAIRRAAMQKEAAQKRAEGKA